MRKELKKWGDSVVIVLSPEDLKVYNLDVGDFIEIGKIEKVNLNGGKK